MSALGVLGDTGVVLVTFPRGTELLIILLVILLLFGARKLPDLANSVGRSLKEFRRGAQGTFDDDEVEDSDDEAAAPDRDAER